MVATKQLFDTIALNREETGVDLGRRHRTIRLKPRVLVADDDAPLRAVVALALGRAGFRVSQAADGMEAIDRLAGSGARTGCRFVAIVADVRMPGLSGLDVLTVLRCASLETPVLLMSAFVDRDVRAEARALGAAGLVAKPLDLDALTAAVATMVRGGRQARQVA
jgi:DNA-binding response OmpR family regulator